MVLSLDGPGGKSFVAVVVPRGFCSGPDLRELCTGQVGDHASSTIVLVTRKVPRAAGGDVDTAAVARAIRSSPSVYRYQAPTTSVEVELTRIWGEVIGRSRVSVTDNFLDIGGTSLHAVQITALVAERLGRQVELEELFDADSLGTLAALISRRSPTTDNV